MKAIVNAKVKYREFFRPFAPSVPLDHVHEYFDVAPGTSLPFMLKIPRVRESVRHLIPAVTHEDGTGRVQTVTEDVNPVFYRLLKRVGAATGVPVLLNTSFNVRGEPVVCSADDAYRCFTATGIDVLVLGQHLIEHKPAIGRTPEQGYAMSNTLEQGGTDAMAAVASCYRRLPFNAYSNSLDFARELMSKNRVTAYPLLHRHLKKQPALRVLDVGCGAGWFVNSCVHYYRHQVTGVEQNAVALKQADAVARLLRDRSRLTLVHDNLFDYAPGALFDVVNSLGVLHHTPDCLEAVRRVSAWVQPGGYLHLGLYHRHGRGPFLDYFSRLRAGGATEHELRAAFGELVSEFSNDLHQESWFRDQVLHPHETQHTFEEVGGLLRSLGFVIEGVSLDGFTWRPNLTNIIAREHEQRTLGERALARKQYFPGFFVVWARRAGVDR